MNLFTAKWPFYISGPLLAILGVGSLYLFNDVIGMGDAMTVANEYCENVVENGTSAAADLPTLDWQLGLLIGIFVGALLTAAIGGAFKPEVMTEGAGSFTVKTLRTVGCGLLGGLLVMLGVQLGGDSIFGQIASATQLSGGAWLFLISMTITGCTLAILLERRGEGGKGGGKTVAKKGAK